MQKHINESMATMKWRTMKWNAAGWNRRVGVMLLMTRAVQSTIFQIDDTRPFLSVGGVPVKWDAGAGAEWVLSSLLVRINPRGLFFKAQTWHLRDLSGLGWSTMQCTASAYGLCQTGFPNWTSIVFPSDFPPVINQDREDECQSTGTNRIVSNEPRYDVSTCDVLDAKRDLVLAENAIHIADTALPDWIYWVECVLVVYLVRCLSKYILASLARRQQKRRGGDKSDGGQEEGQDIKQDNKQDSNQDTKARVKSKEILPNPFICVLACAGCAILIISQGDWCFVTEEDLIFFWFVVFYIAAYGAIFLGARGARAWAYVRGQKGGWGAYTSVMRKLAADERDPPFYNLLAGVLQLVASRLFAGAETPYNPPLIFVVAVRALVKSRRGVDPLRCATLLLDAWLLALMCVWAFGPDPRYLLAIGVAAAAWVDFLV